MALDKGRYYTRSRKVNGRVFREYVGTGEAAEQAARLDAIQREEREAERAARQAHKAEVAAVEAEITALSEAVDLAARAALLAAGYHQHKGGGWRKKRGNCKSPECDGPDRSGGTEETH
jgi:hypothetical protein